MGFSSSMTSCFLFLLRVRFLGLVLSCCICHVSSAHASDVSNVLTQLEHPSLELILGDLAADLSTSERVTRISGSFLGLPYQANTLVGGPDKPERLIADLGRFDCFTYLDTVEALRRSKSAGDFIRQLIKVRYKNEHVSYISRRHFFSDWVNTGLHEIVDVTVNVGPASAVRVLKTLNKRSGDNLWLEGLPLTERTVTYLPTSKIDETALSRLRDGDYVGIYSDEDGLDVMHTGIIVKHGSNVLLRHASSSQRNRAIVDDNLLNYLRDKVGIVVFRVRTSK